MITKSLVKLIDEAIIPALALIVGKMAALFLTIYFQNLPFAIKDGQIFGILPSIQFLNLTDYVRAENYSNLAMFSVACAGTIFVLIRAHFFHESHIHPVLQSKLIKLNLENLIAPSYHLYHQAAIWLLFLWLSVGFLITSTILGVTYPQISIIAFVVAANFSWVFTTDIEREVEISRQSP